MLPMKLAALPLLKFSILRLLCLRVRLTMRPTLDTRRSLFQLPELLSRWLDQAPLGFARFAKKRTARFCKLRTDLFQCVCTKCGATGPKRQGHQESAQGVEWENFKLFSR
jgi:hypothetical protein